MVWLHCASSELDALAANAFEPECTGLDTTCPRPPVHVHGLNDPDSKPPLTTPPPPPPPPDPDGDGDGDGVPPLPLVNGSNVWLNCQVDWLIPEQLSLAGLPRQPPLSRCSAQ